MTKWKLIPVAIFVFLVTSIMVGQATASNEAAVETAYGDWRKAMSSGSAENVVMLYSPKAVLLATFEAEPLVGHDLLLPYFKKLTALPKLSVKPQKSLEPFAKLPSELASAV